MRLLRLFVDWLLWAPLPYPVDAYARHILVNNLGMAFGVGFFCYMGAKIVHARLVAQWAISAPVGVIWLVVAGVFVFWLHVGEHKGRHVGRAAALALWHLCVSSSFFFFLRWACLPSLG
jgi:hypothetical protein